MAGYTIVAVFDDYGKARSAVREIESSETAGGELSLVANNAGARYGTFPQPHGEPGEAEGGLLARIGALTIPGIGPAVAAGPAAALLRGRGLVGALVGIGVPREEAELYAEAVRRGATLVAARVAAAERDRVSGILESCGPIAVAERAAEWRREGWRGFDASGSPHPGPYYGSATTTSGAPADQGISAGRPPESGPPGGWTIRREGPIGADWNEPRVRTYPPDAEEEISNGTESLE
ncbi:MAG TPA: hypothetical protein VJ770_27660 [Stellaceae bacterium]|nr:hypothetical protein [Stellaceae bacterium]